MSDMLQIDLEDDIAVLTMNRPAKRNAMCDELLDSIDAFFSKPPKQVKVVVLTGTEGHFCSGLDLSEHVSRDAEGTMRHSRGWHAVMERIQFGGLPVVSAMFGAVIGGGLELAAATHVRIAESTTIFQLPEGRRGIFVGGGASVRVGRMKIQLRRGKNARPGSLRRRRRGSTAYGQGFSSKNCLKCPLVQLHHDPGPGTD